MIIQLCGTNASGKTTAVTRLLSMGRDAREITGEKGKVVGHELTLADKLLRVLGPYRETGATSRGMDALGGTAEWQYKFIKEQHDEAGVLLYEGMRLHNMKRTAELINAGIEFHVVLLTTPIDVVLTSLIQRRAARGQPPLEDDKHIRLNYTRARNFATNTAAVGGRLYKVDREEAPGRILTILQNS